MGKGNFLKKVFLSPHPYPSKTFKRNGFEINFKKMRPTVILCGRAFLFAVLSVGEGLAPPENNLF